MPTPPPAPGGKLLPIMAYTGRLGSPKGFLFQLSGKWNVSEFTCWSIWMCREISHFVGKKAQKDQQVDFNAVKKLRKRSGFVIYLWYFKESAFTVVERDAKFYTWCVKGVSFINRRYTKGGTFLSKTVYKRVRGRTSGWSLPVYHFCSTPQDVVNSWRSPKNARLRGRPNVPYYRN